MQARGFLIDRLKYSWPNCIYCLCQPNELKREIKKKNGGGPSRRPSKNLGGMAHSDPPLESPLVQIKVTITNHDFGPDYKLH